MSRLSEVDLGVSLSKSEGRKLLASAQSSGAYATTYAIVVVTGILGVLVNLVFRAVERYSLSWHPSQRGEIPV